MNCSGHHEICRSFLEELDVLYMQLLIYCILLQVQRYSQAALEATAMRGHPLKLSPLDQNILRQFIRNTTSHLRLPAFCDIFHCAKGFVSQDSFDCIWKCVVICQGICTSCKSGKSMEFKRVFPGIENHGFLSKLTQIMKTSWNLS